MSRILFLDVDGVVLPVGAMQDTEVADVFKDPFAHLDLVCSRHSIVAVVHLKRLAVESRAQFVLISSWRRFFPVDFNEAFLKRIGLFEHFHPNWYAHLLGFSSRKSNDIGGWLGDHPRIRHRDCLVIDDEDLMLGTLSGLRIRQHMPVSNKGFTEGDLAAVRKVWKLEEAPA